MNYDALVRSAVHTQPVYEPGRPIEVVAREFGLEPAGVAKLASNENPLGPPPEAIAAARESLGEVWLYPDNSCYFLRQALASHLDWPGEGIVFGAGSSDLFTHLCAAFVEPGVETVMGQGAFISYKLATLLRGGTPVEVPLVHYTHDLEAMRAAITERTRLLFLPVPNNPTGTANGDAEVLAFAESLPEHVVFVLDEAYAEYRTEGPDLRPLIRAGRKILCTRTFSKIYALAGLRLGYGYGDPALVRLLDQVRPPFIINGVAQAAALGALRADGWVERARAFNARGLAQLRKGLDLLGVPYVPSEANFLLVEVGEAAAIYDQLQRRGVITRPVGGYGFPRHLRVSVGTDEANARFLALLGECLERPAPALEQG